MNHKNTAKKHLKTKMAEKETLIFQKLRSSRRDQIFILIFGLRKGPQ